MVNSVRDAGDRIQAAPEAAARSKAQVRLPGGRAPCSRPGDRARGALCARKKAIDIETVLIDEFQVKPAAIGEALSNFFGVPYEPFKMDRIKPLDLLKNLKRDYVESSLWVPVEDSKDGLVVHVRLDPERVSASRIVVEHLPQESCDLPCRRRRSSRTRWTSFSGAKRADAASSATCYRGWTRTPRKRAARAADDEVSAAADNELVKLVNKVIVDAYHQGASDIHIEPYPGKGKTEIRFRKDGTLVPYISVPASYRNAIAARVEDHVRPRYLREAQAPGRQDQVQEIRPAGHRVAGGHHSISRRCRRHRHAYPGGWRADPAGQARPVRT